MAGGDAGHYLSEILSWDSIVESWSVAGHLDVPRSFLAVSEVKFAKVADFCN